MLNAGMINPRYDLCPSEKCENCPLDHYGMTCTSHREEYPEAHRGKEYGTYIKT